MDDKEIEDLLSDNEKEDLQGLKHLMKFFDYYNNPDKILGTSVLENAAKPNHCPNCGEKLK